MRSDRSAKVSFLGSTEEDVVTARVQRLGELGNLFRHRHRAQVPALGVGGSGAEGHDGDRVYGDNVTLLISRSFEMVGWLAFSRSR